MDESEMEKENFEIDFEAAHAMFSMKNVKYFKI